MTTLTVYEIPLVAAPQKFSITLAGVVYHMQLTYRDAIGGGWVLDLLDVNFNPIRCGIPLITGADLLAQFKYLGIGGGLAVSTDGDPDAVPTFSNLGAASHLYFVVSA